jgi:hypothetical protein
MLFLLGCERSASDEIDYGAIQNSVYENKYFGLTVKLPDGWDVQDNESLKQLMKIGSEVVAGDDNNLKATIKAAELNTVNLFSVFQFPLGSPVPFNPNVMAIAERVSHAPGIKKGSDYLYHSKKLLETSKLDVTFPYGNSTESIGDREFEVMHVSLKSNGVTVMQKYYAIIMKGYALVFVTTFENEVELNIINNMLKTISIK